MSRDGSRNSYRLEHVPYIPDDRWQYNVMLSTQATDRNNMHVSALYPGLNREDRFVATPPT